MKSAKPEMIKYRLIMGADPKCILTYIDPLLLAKEAAKLLAEEVVRIKGAAS